MWWKSPAKKTTKNHRIAEGGILDYSRVRVKPGMCRDYPRAVLVQVAPTLYLEDDRGLQMGVPSINSSCMRLANSSCPKTRTEPKPRILEVFSKRNNVLEKDLAPPAQPLCLLFIHPRAPNLISLRSADCAPQKFDPALIARFRAVMLQPQRNGTFLSDNGELIL